MCALTKSSLTHDGKLSEETISSIFHMAYNLQFLGRLNETSGYSKCEIRKMYNNELDEFQKYIQDVILKDNKRSI